MFLLYIGVVSPLLAEPSQDAVKAIPTRPATEANIIVENQEVLEECDAEQICVEGQLYNNGAKPAKNVKLKIEIGAIKQSHPRATVMKTVDAAIMQPGDRQDFDFTLDRKIISKDAKGREKIIEVGKYNFRIVPVWSQPKPKSLASKQPKKKVN